MVNTDYIKRKKDPYHIDYNPITRRRCLEVIPDDRELINWKKPGEKPAIYDKLMNQYGYLFNIDKTETMEKFAIRIDDGQEYRIIRGMAEDGGYKYFDVILDDYYPFVLYFRDGEIAWSSIECYEEAYKPATRGFIPLYNIQDNYVRIRGLFKPQPKPDEDIEIGEYTVEFKDDGIKVGCDKGVFPNGVVRAVYKIAKYAKYIDKDRFEFDDKGDVCYRLPTEDVVCDFATLKKIYKRLKKQ